MTTWQSLCCNSEPGCPEEQGVIMASVQREVDWALMQERGRWEEPGRQQEKRWTLPSKGFLSIWKTDSLQLQNKPHWDIAAWKEEASVYIEVVTRELKRWVELCLFDDPSAIESVWTAVSLPKIVLLDVLFPASQHTLSIPSLFLFSFPIVLLSLLSTLGPPLASLWSQT